VVKCFLAVKNKEINFVKVISKKIEKETDENSKMEIVLK
jgi:hypothetical protein